MDRVLKAVPVAMALLCLGGCHSYHIDSTIENRTGKAVRLLEVDYPSASFGAGTVDNGADLHYRFQVRGSGPIKIQYTAAGDGVVAINGPSLEERQEGRLEIVLLPGGRAEFHPELVPHP
jgi:hypothetical protein